MRALFTLFIRLMVRNKTYTALNVIGLAIGMASFILIMMWVNNELSFDRYHEKEERIVRIISFYNLNGEIKNSIGNPAPMAAALRYEFPEIENVVRFRYYGSSSIRYGEKSFSESKLIFADSSLFDVFTIPLIKGNPKTALTEPGTIVLSQKAAEKYFGAEDPAGKIITIDNIENYKVTGIFANFPSASHLQYDFIASANSKEESERMWWLNNNFATYVLLKENANSDAFSKKLPVLIDKYFSAQAEKAIGVPWEKILEGGSSFVYKTQKLADIHLHSDYEWDISVNGTMQYVYIFSIVAFFILFLACINFINLSTAKAGSRGKEIGLKKMFGAVKSQLSAQFIFESFLIVFVSHIVAMILVEISMPYFNELSGKDLSIQYTDYSMILGLFLLIVVTSFAAGSYPAFYLSSFKPATAIKGDAISGKKKGTFRSVLVVGQFVISLILLTCTMILLKQLHFIQNKKMGYDKEHLLVLENNHLLSESIESFKTELLQNSSIQSATVSGYLPIPSLRSSTVVFKDGIKSSDLITYQVWSIDFDYVKTLGLKICMGRDFSTDFSTDSLAVILNQSAAQAFGWEDPLGKTIGIPINETSTKLYKVLGVVEDFNYESVHVPVGPLVLLLGKSTGSVTLRLNANANPNTIISYAEEKWKSFVPRQAFVYDFFDQNLARQYSAEKRLGKILGIFTIMAFVISCLGLFGLAIFTTNQRKKEIGVRKVNGATTTQIIRLLTFDFTKLVFVALLIACPLSYYIMSKWLENFAYHTSISWWIFAVAAILSYVTAILSIAYQSYKAAIANPVDTFRNE